MAENSSMDPGRSAPASHSFTHSAYYIFWVLFSVYVLNYLDRFVLTGAANVVAKELGFSLDGVGYISSAFLIVYTLSAIPIGIWADRVPRKKVLTLCVVFWSLATALSALATNFLMLFLSRMLLGIGEAGLFPAGTALLSDSFRRERRARIMSFWHASQFIGVLGGFVLGGVLAGLFVGGWRLAFLCTGIPGLILAFLSWRIREPRRNQADEEAALLESAGEPGLSIQDPSLAESPVGKQTIWQQCSLLLRIKTLLVITGMQIFTFFVLTVCVTFLPIYLQQRDKFHFTSGMAGLYSGVVVVISGLSGVLAAGYGTPLLERRYAGARVLICGLSFALAAPTLIVALTTQNIIVFTLFFYFTGALLAVYNGPSSAALQDVVPSWLRATAVSLTLLIAHLLGDAISPSLVGVLATSLDPGHGLLFKEGLAGHDLALALLVTCVPALLVAGVIGTVGSRWLQSDVVTAKSFES